MLRRIDPARNMARFYVLSLGYDLFGGISLVRHWGRIGTLGREKIDLFENDTEAAKAFERIRKRKLKRGYSMS